MRPANSSPTRARVGLGRLIVLLVLCLLALPFVAACDDGQDSGPADLTIVSGSENETLEPIVQDFARKNGYRIRVRYQGSVDIMLGLEDASFDVDAVWPAHSLWIELGDEKLKRVKHAESVARSPIVFGIKKSRATQLGLTGRDVTVGDILKATESGKLRFMMTNATQSNSGAQAYLGFVNSFLGQPDAIRVEDLDRPELQARLRQLLAAVNRGSGSSGWLKDLYLKSDATYDGMVNYESVIIETNQELVKAGKEPLYVVYPVDGQAVSDSPLAYVDRSNAKAEKVFLELQKHLLSPETQRELAKLGRRVGVVGLSPASVDKSVFNPDWGIDTQRVINQVRIPQPAVVRRALYLYQIALRKPSLTVYCLDYSGSMDGAGIEGLREAMSLLLTPSSAERYMLQPGPDDLTVVIPFNSRAEATWSVKGNQPAEFAGLLAKVRAHKASGGTDIYLPAVEGLKLMRQQGANLERYQPAIILMTDGKSNSDENMATLSREIKSFGQDIPIFGITFGDADKSQLDDIAELTRGRVFDGRKDLVQAFRSAKGYN